MKIIYNNVFKGINEFNNSTIRCCITSPPYYKCRNYGHSEQIGLENTVEEYIEKLCNVFNLIKPKLTDDVWYSKSIGLPYNIVYTFDRKIIQQLVAWFGFINSSSSITMIAKKDNSSSFLNQETHNAIYTNHKEAMEKLERNTGCGFGIFIRAVVIIMQIKERY